ATQARAEPGAEISACQRTRAQRRVPAPGESGCPGPRARQSPPPTVNPCVTSFINPRGPGHTDNLRPAARPLFAVEAWTGTVSMSVFFALLVRKWFRM
ncbi:hypothetical protein, partial [Nocardia abscessus]|uniref:hypothetical protein n=1 Tax=Nocardia abscessus TaxID=120957 RepID=UPI0024558C37